MRRLLLLAVLISASAQAQTGVLGHWQTPDRDIVEIFPCASGICARILAIHPNAPSHFDANNPDASLRTRSFCNLRIGSSFRLTDPNHAEDGQLYDPETGHTYRGAMSTEGNTLHLRGYIGIKLFGRTETWTRVPANAPLPPCT